MRSKRAATGRRSVARGYGLALLAAALCCAILVLMNRPPICACGRIELWHGALDSGNSQHLADWYSLSHVIHGFLFYAVIRWLRRDLPVDLGLALAVGIEGAWEIAENSPWIIDRYRTATIALGYSGDSIVNSMSDIGMMTIGFLFAARARRWATVIVAIVMELVALVVIRDNLTLNILMLTWPLDAVRQWQAAL